MLLSNCPIETDEWFNYNTIIYPQYEKPVNLNRLEPFKLNHNYNERISVTLSLTHMFRRDFYL